MNSVLAPAIVRGLFLCRGCIGLSEIIHFFVGFWIFLLIFVLVTSAAMRIEFDKEYLKDLYEKGVSDKKHRFQPEVVKKYVKVINIMKNAGRVEDLFPFASLHYEVLNGDMKGIESVRVNDKYRVEFQSYAEGAEVKVTVCNILELSNHYQ